MPRGHLGGPQAIGQGEQFAHLDRAVARDTGARRAPRQVRVDERVDHFAAKEVAAIERVVRDPQLVGHAPRVVLIFGSAAAPANRAVVGIIPEVQRDADHVVPRLDEPRGGDRRVNPAAHGDDDAFSGV